MLRTVNSFRFPTVLLSCNAVALAGWGTPDPEEIAVAQIAAVDTATVQDAVADGCAADDGPLLHVPSPDWRDQVIYMLMIDRFSDGDPGNNDQGYGEYDPSLASHFSGGDLQGVMDRLDYIRSLGATAVWITPPVYNQWWSTPYQAAGWHGYWAVHFQEIDPHFGTLETYKRLSHELHCRGMYLIQDIVANHAGNFFGYDGEYDPGDTARNFYLLEPDSHQPAPVQYPFNQIDRLNPEHFAADIYHWTPPVQDYFRSLPGALLLARARQRHQHREPGGHRCVQGYLQVLDRRGGGGRIPDGPRSCWFPWRSGTVSCTTTTASTPMPATSARSIF